MTSVPLEVHSRSVRFIIRGERVHLHNSTMRKPSLNLGKATVTSGTRALNVRLAQTRTGTPFPASGRVHLPACPEGSVRLPGFSPCLVAGFSSSSPSGPIINSGLEERRLSSRLSVGS